jgi:hypothetical protein
MSGMTIEVTCSISQPQVNGSTLDVKASHDLAAAWDSHIATQDLTAVDKVM